MGLHISTYGRPLLPRAPTVLLIHGAGMDHTVWALQGRHLAFHGWNALAVDLPGHGRSGWYDEPLYLPRDMATDIIPVLETVRPDLVVGMSMGGLTAIAVAGLRPDLLSRLVLVDVSPGSTPERSTDITDFTARDVFDSLEDMVRHTRAL